MVSTMVSSWGKETMKITHSYHKRVGESLENGIHAKEHQLELEIIFTNHKLKITAIGLPEIYVYPADWETQTILLFSLLAKNYVLVILNLQNSKWEAKPHFSKAQRFNCFKSFIPDLHR